MATVIARDGQLIVRQRESLSGWPLSHIVWLQADGHRTQLHLIRETCVLPVGLAALAHGLPRDQFQRINRSLIINRRHVKSVTPGTRGRVHFVMSDGTALAGLAASSSTWLRNNRPRPVPTRRIDAPVPGGL